MSETESKDFICPICGKSDLVPSVITLTANYGSKHDGEKRTVILCADCFDWFYEAIPPCIGEKEEYM